MILLLLQQLPVNRSFVFNGHRYSNEDDEILFSRFENCINMNLLLIQSLNTLSNMSDELSMQQSRREDRGEDIKKFVNEEI